MKKLIALVIMTLTIGLIMPIVYADSVSVEKDKEQSVTNPVVNIDVFQKYNLVNDENGNIVGGEENPGGDETVSYTHLGKTWAVEFLSAAGSLLRVPL